jgi:hypothetical protein
MFFGPKDQTQVRLINGLFVRWTELHSEISAARSRTWKGEKSHTSKEAAWHSRLQQHAHSGKSIAAFCRSEAVSTASFCLWRATLAACDCHWAQPTAFIDRGAIFHCQQSGQLSARPVDAVCIAGELVARWRARNGVSETYIWRK